jgi:hypothetical protein
MKNFIAFVLLLVISVSSYANTNNDLDKGKKKKQSKAVASVLNIVEEEPVDDLTGILASGKSEVNVKVFDITGKIVFEKKVKIESILSNKYKMDELPKKSVFVMLHNNTAYYFQEESK